MKFDSEEAGAEDFARLNTSVKRKRLSKRGNQ